MRVLAGCLVVAACGRIGFDPSTTNTGDGAMDSTDSAPGSIALVQAAPITTILSAAAQATFMKPPIAGDLIIVYAWTWNMSGSTLPAGAVIDTGSNPYQLAATIATVGVECDGGQAAAAIFYAIATATTVPLTVKVTPASGASHEIGLVAVEYAGLVAADGAGTNKAAGTASPFTFMSGGVTTSGGPRLLASVANECAGSPGTVTFTENDGFTLRGKQLTTDQLQPGYAADKIVAAPGMYSDTWTVGYSGLPYPGIGIVAAFK